jgi:dual specificity tyrosine-phosphorylation-regulated kinase 2/3/4
VSSVVDEDEVLGDEEMMAYIKKQQAKKLAAGVSQAELDEMLRFPEPIAPGNPTSPAGMYLMSWYTHATDDGFFQLF